METRIASSLFLVAIIILGLLSVLSVPVGASQTIVHVTISNYTYIPATITVVIGTNNTVTWTNNDSVPHTVTAIDGSFDSGNLPQGGTFTHIFTSSGAFAYYCTYHPYMTGEVLVKAAGAATTTTTASSTTTTSSSSSTTASSISSSSASISSTTRATGGLYLFMAQVSLKGVAAQYALVFIMKGVLTIASGFTNSQGIFGSYLPRGSYTVTACQTSACSLSANGAFPQNAEGGSLALDFANQPTTTSSITSTAVGLPSVQSSSQTSTRPVGTTTSPLGGGQSRGLSSESVYEIIGVATVMAVLVFLVVNRGFRKP